MRVPLAACPSARIGLQRKTKASRNEEEEEEEAIRTN